jgi:phage/plasmid-like protein (TIGR03299 family)
MKTFQEKTFDLLESTGLNWSVRKDSLVSLDGHTTESFGIFRNDSNQWLGTVGNRYEPMQNSTLAETIIQATDNINLETQKGGMFDDGKKVYLQAMLPDEYIGNSGVQRCITAVNSHDGSTSIGFGSSSTVIVCKNTFYKAFKTLDKFRHTASAEERLRVAMLELKEALKLDQDLMDNFKRMSDSPLKEDMIEGVIRKMFAIDVKNDKTSTRKANQVTAFADSLRTEVTTHGSTLWALFNGVTRYTNHIAAPRDKKEEYVTVGTGYKTNLMAYDECMKWLESNTASFHFINR